MDRSVECHENTPMSKCVALQWGVVDRSCFDLPKTASSHKKTTLHGKFNQGNWYVNELVNVRQLMWCSVPMTKQKYTRNLSLMKRNENDRNERRFNTFICWHIVRYLAFHSAFVEFCRFSCVYTNSDERARAWARARSFICLCEFSIRHI